LGFREKDLFLGQASDVQKHGQLDALDTNKPIRRDVQGLSGSQFDSQMRYSKKFRELFVCFDSLWVREIGIFLLENDLIVFRGEEGGKERVTWDCPWHECIAGNKKRDECFAGGNRTYLARPIS
jgi:hypothetical protein